MAEEYITNSELAKVLGISRQAMSKQLKNLISSGRIDATLEGTTYLIRFNTLPQEIRDRFKEAQSNAAKKAKELVQKPQKDLNFEKIFGLLQTNFVET